MAVKIRKRKTAPPEGTPEELELFKMLSDVMGSVDVEVRVEKGDFRGGMCVVDGDREMIFLNKKHTLDSRISILINEVNKRGLSEQLPQAAVDIIAKIRK